MKYSMAIVRCLECGEEHDVQDIEFLNVEEGPTGGDLVTYKCPETGNETKAYVLG